MLEVVTDETDRDWTEPGVYLVSPGVYRIPLPLPTDGLRAVNVYAVRDNDTLVLVDSGWAIEEAREQLDRALAAIDTHLSDVDHFLVTHVHRDHYTQAILVRQEFGTRIGLGAGERPSLDVLTGSDTRTRFPHAARLRAAGAHDLLAKLAEARRASRSELKAYEAPDEWFADGTRTAIGDRTLRAIATPGHTRGHLVYADEPAGLLFAGDHVLPHITPSIGFEPAPAEHPLRDYLDSLRLVRALPDMRLLPAHGPVTGSAHARIDALLDHHDHRLDATLAAVEHGATTAVEVAGRLTWTRRDRTLAELDLFNAMLAVLETLSHLDLLVLQGRVTSAVVDGTRHYSV